MKNSTRTFTVTDPRFYDGNPLEVAARAAGQVLGITDLLISQLEAAEIMGRNAYMEQQARSGEEIDAKQWFESAEYKSWVRVAQQLAATRGTLKALREKSSYDPKKPPKERL